MTQLAISSYLPIHPCLDSLNPNSINFPVSKMKSAALTRLLTIKKCRLCVKKMCNIFLKDQWIIVIINCNKSYFLLTPLIKRLNAPMYLSQPEARPYH